MDEGLGVMKEFEIEGVRHVLRLEYAGEQGSCYLLSGNNARVVWQLRARYLIQPQLELFGAAWRLHCRPCFPSW